MVAHFPNQGFIIKVVDCTEINYKIMVSYHIISYPILSYPILSYPILSYPILSYPILSYPILSYPILSYPILSYPILSYPIISYHMYLLLAEYSVRTASYRPGFLLPFMAQAQSAWAMKTRKEKTRIHNLPYGPRKRG